MYRSLLLITFLVSYCDQLLAQDVKSSDSGIVEHVVQITEFVLTDDGPDTLEEIAANFWKYTADGKGEIVQQFSLTVQDGHNTMLAQSIPIELLRPSKSEHRFQSTDAALAKHHHWIGSAIQLSAKANEQSVQIVLTYAHSFVPNLSPDSKTTDLVVVRADEKLDLNNAVPVAIKTEPVEHNARLFDHEVPPISKKIYLIVSIDQKPNSRIAPPIGEAEPFRAPETAN
ncbi:hypothetical protein Q31b_49260 [Novipirellula aureliae]|uniref:Uncharacterized protein n=2 Tax=Novipirellula aureliae TaxID=2527966 RepID=A0A5C6DK70_9BACT|nr:hypothetical protein Q31b_49260 [Novipirellula aureliae]